MKDASLVSADELHAYGNFLKRSEEDLISLIQNVANETIRISEQWDDSVNVKFAEEFSGYIREITKLVSLMDDHSNFVHRKASGIEYYKSV